VLKDVPGSSPRTRGTQFGGPGSACERRFIPAHAGNTRGRRADTCRWTVHPRARGEHCQFTLASLHDVGSSPRTRGTRLVGLAERIRFRFIPAHAGNTHRRDSRPDARPVHPRARGEHNVMQDDQIGKLGSSPRTRGTRQSAGPTSTQVRFIPAHAGNT